MDDLSHPGVALLDLAVNGLAKAGLPPAQYPPAQAGKITAAPGASSYQPGRGGRRQSPGRPNG
jgi:hypothetical protein